MKRSELIGMSRDDLTELLSDTLLVTLMRGAEENNKIIPDGIQVQTETENFKLTFDIIVDVETKTPGISDHSFHIYKPGEL